MVFGLDLEFDLASAAIVLYSPVPGFERGSFDYTMISLGVIVCSLWVDWLL